MLKLIIKYVMYYLFTGVVFSFIVDIASDYARRKGIEVPPESDWNWETRAIAVLVWPLGLIAFLSGYIKERFNNKK